MEKSQKFDENKLNVLAELVCLKIEELFADLEINLNRVGRIYMGACPIHEGERYSSFNLYPEGESVPGYWKCWSHHCESIFKPTIIGFVRGVLSSKKLGWRTPSDVNKTYPFHGTIDWLCNFVGQSFDALKVNIEEVEKRKFANYVDCFKKKPIKKHAGIAREIVRRSLIIPAEYYIKRGYSKEILNTYDVGLCNNPKKEMYNRVVVPMYDSSTGLMIGCSGRSIFEECKRCKCHHSTKVACPKTADEKFHTTKWKNQNNFSVSSQLYNFWRAKGVIAQTATAVLVESAGNVWRLEEAEIKNSLGMFGVHLSDEQQIILESSGAMKIIVLLDKGAAGTYGTDRIKKQLGRSYNLYFPQFSNSDDIGAMTTKEIKSEILPIIEEIIKK
jgi:NADH:ubiquinone oxidoreductase subunit